jgi:hypothetical protein
MTMRRAILTAVDSPIRAAAVGSEYLMMTTYGDTR